MKGPPVPTIEAPVRLEGALKGVLLRFAHATEQGPKQGPVLDCRLLLALDDLAGVAREFGVSELFYNSIYRGRGGRPGWRHPAGVAIDIVALRSKEHGLLKVEKDFVGNGIGSETCTGTGPPPSNPRAAYLRRFLCRVHEAHIFNLILTPHYDRHHQDHVHLEVRRGIKWYLTQ
jgi:GNAT superfamily N-acetyltransferase